jgi:hypothetical protein
LRQEGNPDALTTLFARMEEFAVMETSSIETVVAMGEADHSSMNSRFVLLFPETLTSCQRPVAVNRCACSRLKSERPIPKVVPAGAFTHADAV